ncbi:MAG: ABC transporter permease [Cyanobacteria bacterium P01_E01_bin.45]
MVSIARRNLFADIPRLLVAQAGIMFAVSLVTIQTGILEGFTRSTTLVIENSPAEVWVASEDMVYLELTSSSLSTEQVDDLLAIEGVEAAEPLFLSANRWDSESGNLTPVRMYGFDPNGTLFDPGPVVEGSREDLNQPFTAIADLTQLEALGVTALGEQAELNLIFVELAGIVRDSQSIASSTHVYLSLGNAYDYMGLPYVPADDGESLPIGPTTYFLLDLADAADFDVVSEQVSATLPGYMAFSKSEMIARTRHYWSVLTGVGFILGMGAVVGVIVGVAIVGQILYSSVSDRLQDYGTLKAMGADDRMLYGIILRQAVLMAVLGYAPGMALCLGLSRWAMVSQGVLILITPTIAAGVFGLTIAMCSCSAIFAIQKATRVDPSIVFKS